LHAAETLNYDSDASGSMLIAGFAPAIEPEPLRQKFYFRAIGGILRGLSARSGPR
jgi:hypothetical protein